jgi:hypothetical protein
MIFCLKNIDSFSYTDPLKKRSKNISTSVTGLVDAFHAEGNFQN